MSSDLIILIPILQIALILLFAVLLFWIVWRLFRWLISLFFSAGDSGSALSRLVSLAIAVPLYPSFVWYLQDTLPRLVESIFVGFPVTLIESWREVGQSCEATSSLECLRDLTEPLLSNWIFFFRRILSDLRIPEFPVIDTIFLFAVWLVLAAVLDWIISKRASGLMAAFGEAYGFFAKIPRAAKLNVVFMGLLLVAGYLSLTSIIAIPILSGEQAEDSTLRQTLEAELEKKGPSQADTFLQKFKDNKPKEFKDLPVIDTDKLIATVTAGTKSTPNIERLKDTLQRLQNNMKARHSELTRSWGILITDYVARDDEMRDSAILTFAINEKARKGYREKAQHLIDINRWYRSANYEWQKQIRVCLGAVQKFEDDVSTSHSNLNITAERAANGASFESSNLLISSIEASDSIRVSADSAREACDSSGSLNWRVPDRVETGTFLGPFGAAAGYILRTESLALALISGLLGFGLLGATASTFIKEREKHGEEDPWVKDLMGVIIRGISAAVVMFLAVYGGLAVFSASEAAPNPYVVLFACLVAGVFSENVWIWARIKLDNLLKGSSGGDGDNTPPEKPVQTSTQGQSGDGDQVTKGEQPG